MEIKYFNDTDTLMVTFNNSRITETKDLNENVLVEFDKTGNIVCITIEHAKNMTDVSNFSFQQVTENIENNKFEFA
jgi:uncharacterized protein YuzE